MTFPMRASASSPPARPSTGPAGIKQKGDSTFTVEPAGDDSRSSVRITTEREGKGLAGMIERLLVPVFLRKVYREELANPPRIALEGRSP